MTNTQVFSDLECWSDDFIRNATLTSTPEAATGWTAIVTGSGSPTAKTLDGAATGAMRHLCDATSAAQTLCQTFKDCRPFGIANLKTVNILGQMSNADSHTQGFYGVGGVLNASSDTQATAGSTAVLANMTELIGFPIGSGGEVFCEGRGGGLDSGCVDTGYAFPTGVQVLMTIDLSKASNVKFYMSTQTTGFRPVCGQTKFDLSNFTGSLQPVLETGKTVGSTNQTTFDLDKFWVEYVH